MPKVWKYTYIPNPEGVFSLTSLFPTMRRRACALAILAFALVSLVPASAYAGFRTRGYGPVIDNSFYEGQSKCQPAPKPGVLAFRSMVLNAFPVFGVGGISRGCSIGGQSEHKEGRAWDMSANAGYESHRAAVKRLFDKLLATDRYGNEAALAKRLGIMYMIWNRRIWGTWSGWSTYCVQKPRGCVDPDEGGLRHPHTDHVHFSFTWAGARKQSTYYYPERSMMTGVAAHPSWGYWLLGANGGVTPFQTGWYGSRSDSFLPKPAVGMASTTSGGGYWIVTRAGRVFAFGDAKNRGFVKGLSVRIVDIEVTPTGKGYWLLAKSGRVFPLGDATKNGGATDSGGEFAAMASTPSGNGYWLFGTRGNVFAFGDARDLGGLANEDLDAPVVGGDNLTDGGYWLITSKGRVEGFGTAQNLGDPRDKTLDGVAIGLAANPAGTGYWIATSKGRVLHYGEAEDIGSMAIQDVGMFNSARVPTGLRD
ncbi:MAG: hypothetical protein M3277_09565 [Actinomycetota bacterium]|nr:hypothetical protein [Actinomycetota bacterium]